MLKILSVILFLYSQVATYYSQDTQVSIILVHMLIILMLMMKLAYVGDLRWSTDQH